jgi:hypothetical protein
MLENARFLLLPRCQMFSTYNFLDVFLPFPTYSKSVPFPYRIMHFFIALLDFIQNFLVFSNIGNFCKLCRQKRKKRFKKAKNVFVINVS